MNSLIPVPKNIFCSCTAETCFHPIANNDESKKFCTEVFNNRIAPIYGDQTKALKKIFLAKDRIGYFLYTKNRPAGVLLHKTKPTNEYESKGVQESLEIKSLFLINPKENGKQGLGTQLIRKAETYANKKRYQSLHVTVNESKLDSYLFFLKHNFFPVSQLKSTKIDGKREFLLQKIMPPIETPTCQCLTTSCFHTILGTLSREDYFCSQAAHSIETKEMGLMLKIFDHKEVKARMACYQNTPKAFIVYEPPSNQSKETNLIKIRHIHLLDYTKQVAERVIGECIESIKTCVKKDTINIQYKTDSHDACTDLLKKYGFIKKDSSNSSDTFYYSLPPNQKKKQMEKKDRKTTKQDHILNNYNFSNTNPNKSNNWNLDKKKDKSYQSDNNEIPKVYNRNEIRKEQKKDFYQPITLKKQYIQLIREGKKTVEGRIHSGIFSKVKKGHKFRFYAGHDEVLCTVVETRLYSGFREMLEKEGVKNLLPGTRSVEQGVKIYESLPHYIQRARKNGVIALQLRVEN